MQAVVVEGVLPCREATSRAAAASPSQRTAWSRNALTSLESSPASRGTATGACVVEGEDGHTEVIASMNDSPRLVHHGMPRRGVVLDAASPSAPRSAVVGTR